MKLADYLAAKGLTQAQFAVQIGRAQQAVSRYCAGKAPDAATMRRIIDATAGEVTANDFFPAVAKPHTEGAAA